MRESLFSPSWYRVAGVRPRLRPHTAIHRQVFRDKVWHILQDHQTGRFHRLSPIANLMVCLMDGRRSMQEIWEAVGEKAKDAPPTQDDTIKLLSQLHSADLLQGEIPPDFNEIAERSETASRRRLLQRLRNPIAQRIPLFDPNRLLDLTLPLVRPFFTTFGFLCWLGLVGAGFTLAALHWSELTADVVDRVLAAENVALMMAIYPLIKSLHELGHAYATKIWGGEVHEIGVMMLVFIPMLYVDASASAAFAHKRRRIVVGAAGILVETALAALAMIVWINASPGLGRTVAFNVMLIGGVSTLLVNGNPLLRFDGYYIFSDLIEIPNLGARANSYFFYLIQKHIFKIPDLDSPLTEPGEAKWMLSYAVLSFIYRLSVSVGVALFLSTRLFFFGAILAFWAMASIAVTPVFKGLKFLATSPRLRSRRGRAALIVGGASAALALALFVVPLPYATVVEGIVIVPDQAEVRARSEGFIATVSTQTGADVTPGQELVRLEDPNIKARVEVIEAQLEETRHRYIAIELVDRVQAQMLADQITHLTGRLETFRERERELSIVADQPGRFIMPRAADMMGRYVKRGDLIGYVIGDANVMARVAAPQSEIDVIRHRTVDVDAYMVENLARSVPAHIVRETPAAGRDVPSLALTTRGGGDIALDPSRTHRPEALFSLFLIDVELLESSRDHSQGSRVYVRFRHGDEAIAWRLIRAARQFFLGQFNV